MMAAPKKHAELKRVWVKITDETKRQLDFLAVDAGTNSTEVFCGELLAKAAAELWQRFDPKRRHAAEIPKRAK